MTSNAFKIEQNIKICAVTVRGSTHRGKMRETRKWFVHVQRRSIDATMRKGDGLKVGTSWKRGIPKKLDRNS